MNRSKEQQHLINSATLEFADFKPFNFQKEFKKSENKTHLQSKLRDFFIHEVIDRVEKTYFELRCSVGAMAFIERMTDYAWIEHGVGTLLLASCEVAVRIDFDLAEATIMYDVVDPKSEQVLATYVIAE